MMTRGEALSDAVLKADKSFLKYVEFGGCEENGRFLGREDGCCVYEDKDCGCTFHDYCRARRNLVTLGILPKLPSENN